MRVLDQAGNVAPRELVFIRLDDREGHSDRVETISHYRNIGVQNSDVDDANAQDTCDDS